ncbi:MAG TPA: hypothetical protein VIN02_01040 [Sulfurovum sp.]
MFKKTLLSVLLSSLMLGSSMAEESNNSLEAEEISPIKQCDEQYTKCADVCGDYSLPNPCLEQCQKLADQCYNNVLSENEEESESAEDEVE